MKKIIVFCLLLIFACIACDSPVQDNNNGNGNENKQDITYNLNSGENHVENLVNFDDLSLPYSLKNPTKDGFTFGGWYTTSGFDPLSRIEVIENDNESITLYAKWNTLGTYTKPAQIEYNLDYTGVNQNFKPIGFDSSVMIINDNSLTNVGNYSATISLIDPLTTKWEDESTESISINWSISKALNAWVEIPSIANWVENRTASEPTGSAQFGAIVFSYEDSAGTVLSEKPTTVGNYTLIASVEGTDNYSAIQTEINFSITESEFTVTFYKNNDEENLVLTVQSGDTVSMPDYPLKDKYAFNGWFTDEECTTQFDDSIGITKDVSVHAYWHKMLSFRDPSTNLYYIYDGDSKNPKAGILVIPSTYGGYQMEGILEGGFGYTSNYTDVIILDGIKTIGTEAFQRSSGLRSIVIPDSVTLIEEDAFYGCDYLEEVQFSQNLHTIEGGAFWGCDFLETVTLPESLTTIGAHIFNSSGLKSITLPKNVTTIPYAAFQNCKNLREYYITENITTIDRHAFDSTNVRSVTIPATLKNIGEDPFCLSTDATFYLEHTEVPAWPDTDYSWHYDWYGSENQRKVILGCTLDAETRTYVVSITKKTDSAFGPYDSTSSYYKPTRPGHTFLGWSKWSGGPVEYTLSNFAYAVEEGQTIYTVWEED